MRTYKGIVLPVDQKKAASKDSALVWRSTHLVEQAVGAWRLLKTLLTTAALKDTDVA